MKIDDRDMKKRFIFVVVIAMISTMLVSCRDYDDFEFSGQMVGYRFCSSMNSFQDLGYIVRIDSPDSIGGTLVGSDGETMDNVLVIYQSDRLLKDGQHIHGKIYLDSKFSKVNCNFHSTGPDKDLPEAVFTKLVVD